MQIFIKALTGQSFFLEVESSDSIKLLKEKICNHTGIDVFQQRLVFCGKDLQDENTLSDYCVRKGSTINYVLRLRGNGDMMKNHIKSTYPLKDEENISLNSTISLTFDLSIASVDTTGLFKVKCKRTDSEIPGTTVFDSQSRTVTFVSKSLLPPDEVIQVFTFSEAVQNQHSRLWSDYSWEFKTRSLSPLTLGIITPNIDIKRKITLDGKTGSLFSELISKSSFEASIDPNMIEKIFFSGTDITIEDDLDVLQLDNHDVLDISLKK